MTVIITSTYAERRKLIRSAIGSILPVGALSMGAAVVIALRFELSVLYAAKALLVMAAGAVAILRGLPEHHPFQSIGAANRTTVVRATLVALLAALIGEHGGPSLALLATVLAIVAAILDFVDGKLARRTGMASGFGARFDMETDAALILILSVLAWQFGKAGPWVLLAGLMRYLYVAAGFIAPWLRAPLSESLLRKAIAVLQMVALIALIAPFMSTAVTLPFAVGSLAALTYSFGRDVLTLQARANA